jgi:hypothetical protein
MELISIILFVAITGFFFNQKTQEKADDAGKNQSNPPPHTREQSTHVSKNKTPKQVVSDEVSVMKKDGIPLMEIWRRLNDKMGVVLDSPDCDIDLAFAYDGATRAIMDVVVDRNLKGIEYEDAGKEAQAIKLYKANLAASYDGSHPYERLRIIYTRKKKYEAAMLVCSAFINNKSINNPEMKQKFIKHFNKLSAMNSEQEK